MDTEGVGEWQSWELVPLDPNPDDLGGLLSLVPTTSVCGPLSFTLLSCHEAAALGQFCGRLSSLT